MRKTAIITDSSCDLSTKTLDQHNIHILPLRVIYNDREYLDKIDISPEELYSSLKHEHPSTSLPDIQYAESLINRLKNEGYSDFIFVCVSEVLSGTINCIRILMEDHPDINYQICDGKTVGFPIGAMALKIRELLDNNITFDKIKEVFPIIRENTRGYIAVNTLEFLVKGGRISALKGTLGEILSMKPIISSNDEGRLFDFATIRGRKKSINKLKEVLGEYLASGPCKVWILHGDASEEASKFLDEVKDLKNITQISLEVIGAAMGVHTGPGVIGFCVQKELSNKELLLAD